MSEKLSCMKGNEASLLGSGGTNGRACGCCDGWQDAWKANARKTRGRPSRIERDKLNRRKAATILKGRKQFAAPGA
eukprot:5238392-Pleurochrysis_carterae.AAC.1